eukprot:GHVQ01025757.1.p2 GENE.GHVQ01025757.1~~GHVQ01025757.1.p2  ORF type:complete len:246 (+),score=24.81 GHVQ01025757.1:22-738(+)
MAMVNYPYATDFIMRVPAWPVKHMCFELLTSHTELVAAAMPEQKSNDDDLYTDLWKAMRFALEKLGLVEPGTCLNTTSSTDNFSDNGWNYLACTSQALVTTTNGKTDMFPGAPFDVRKYSEMCRQQFNVEPDLDWVERYTGTNFADCTNIVFSNGMLDPWSTGGVLNSPTASCPAYLMEGAAHHLDLRLPHPRDPPDVVDVRKKHISWLKQWIHEFHNSSTRHNDTHEIRNMLNPREL